MDECKGCVTYDDDNNECLLDGINNVELCPCRTCIVKSMCNQPCDIYEQYQTERLTPGSQEAFRKYKIYPDKYGIWNDK